MSAWERVASLSKALEGAMEVTVALDRDVRQAAAVVESVTAERDRLLSEVARLEGLVAVLRPLAESDPCWTVDSVCGYCEGRAGDGATYHKPDCDWLKARAALAPALLFSPRPEDKGVGAEDSGVLTRGAGLSSALPNPGQEGAE